MASKYNDIAAVIQVIGCVYNYPELLENTDQYTIVDDDFENEFHRVIFGTLYKLYELGANKITIENVVDFLSTRPEYQAIYKSNKGDEWLAQASKNANIESFDYYYGRLKKMTLLRAFEKYGVDVTPLYDPDNIFDKDKKQKQEMWLDETTLQGIADEVDKRIEDIKIRYVDENYGEAMQAADGIDDLVDSLKKNPEVGVPLYGPLINTVTRGARLGKFYLRSAPTGIGKRIADYTPIPTPDGWKTVGEIQVGDYIFGKNGKLTKILKLYKNPEKIWKITFSDGRSIDCCGEHLWQYSYKTQQGWVSRVENTQTIYQRAKSNFKDSNNQDWRFKIPLNEPVDYPERTYATSPYEMGLAIGDGVESLPKTYLLGSIEQRYELLAGLLDADGSISDISGNILYITMSKQLVDDVSELCHSLGMITEITTNYKELSVVYTVHIQCKKEIKPKLFKLSSKKQKVLEYVNDEGQDEDKEYLSIINIEPTETITPMTCFTVDAEDALFQVGDFIVTHNTRTMIADACYVACDQIFDTELGVWVKNGIKQPTLFIGTEQDMSEIQTMMLAFLSGVNEEHILNGSYASGEESRIRMAQKILKQAPLYVELLPDFSLQDIENTIKKNLRNRGVNYVFDPIKRVPGQ
jgi:replicative DNA helicase